MAARRMDAVREVKISAARNRDLRSLEFSLAIVFTPKVQ
jgi:hypothetical protein